jgi:hypothetical protein
MVMNKKIFILTTAYILVRRPVFLPLASCRAARRYLKGDTWRGAGPVPGLELFPCSVAVIPVMDTKV